MTFPPWKITVAGVQGDIEAMRSRYAGRIGRYQHECVTRWTTQREGPRLHVGFGITAWFERGGPLLLDWPTTDLDAALERLQHWRRLEGRVTIAGAGRLGSPRLGFDSIVLQVDPDGRVRVREYETGIRAMLRAGVFPQWNVGGRGIIGLR